MVPSLRGRRSASADSAARDRSTASEMNGGENCPVEIAPTVFPRPRLKRLMPSCLRFVAVDAGKAHLEQNLRVGGGTSTLSRFTTLPAVEAIWTARAELVRSFTVPRRKMTPFSECHLQGWSGKLGSELAANRFHAARRAQRRWRAR